MAEDIDHLKHYVGELEDLLSNYKSEVNHVRRIVHACEPGMEDFTTAMDATHSIITSWQRGEATMIVDISTIWLDIGDIQEALKNHVPWMEDVSNTRQQMQEKVDNLTKDIINLISLPITVHQHTGIALLTTVIAIFDCTQKTVMLVPMLASLIIATRVRALQLERATD